jgi:xylulokinase
MLALCWRKVMPDAGGTPSRFSEMPVQRVRLTPSLKAGVSLRYCDAHHRGRCNPAIALRAWHRRHWRIGRTGGVFPPSMQSMPGNAGRRDSATALRAPRPYDRNAGARTAPLHIAITAIVARIGGIVVIVVICRIGASAHRRIGASAVRAGSSRPQCNRRPQCPQRNRRPQCPQCNRRPQCPQRNRRPRCHRYRTSLHIWSHPMPYLLGLDIGTSGAKALLCDEQGRVVASATAEYPLYTPRPLWSEQNPDDWWRGAKQALAAVVAQSGVDAAQIKGLGLTGQMHGAVFLDDQGQVLRPALLWNDQRTAAECDEITARVGASRLIELAGNPALTGFQAPKILWLRNHEPEHYARLAQVLLPKDYIRLLLTGQRATDASDAAGTLLLDLRTRDWSDEILAALDIPRAWLPKVSEGPEVTGELLPDLAHELGLPAGLPVAAGGGDNAAAAVGTGIVRGGIVSSSIGTSGVVFAHADQIALDPQGRLHSFCHAAPGQYHLMAVTLAAGGSFQWLRNTFSIADFGFWIENPPNPKSKINNPKLSYDDLTRLAATVPPGAEGLIFLPYLSGERTPHLDPLARGAFVGLTTRHTLAHITRAVMEGVTYSLRDGLEIMRGLGLRTTEIRATGGGGKSAFWRQMQADVFGAPVATLAAEEGPAYGAALLAGVAAGVFADVAAAVERCVHVTGTTEPDTDAAAQYERVYAIYRDLYPALRDAIHRLA